MAALNLSNQAKNKRSCPGRVIGDTTQPLCGTTRRELCEARVSHTVLREAGGAIPSLQLSLFLSVSNLGSKPTCRRILLLSDLSVVFRRGDGHLRQLHVQRIDFLQTNIPQRKHRTVGCEAGPPSEAARDQRASLDQIGDVLQLMVGEANAI
jgi:hypothetical protein